MKARIFLFLVAATLATIGVWSIFHRGRPTRTTAPRATPTAVSPAVTPAPPKANVAIQDGKTIDFSTGKALIKEDAKEKAAIDQAVATMDAAAATVTFSPRTTSSTAATATTSAAPTPTSPATK